MDDTGSAGLGRKRAHECWKRATEAIAKENWDFAITLFSTAAFIEPDNVVYRQHLRGAEERKYGNNKTGAKMAFMKLNSIRGKIKKARTAKDWVELDKAAEEGLTVNPWDAQFSADVGEAARERGHEEVATYGYERAVQIEGENKVFLIALADIYEMRGNYQGAVGIYQRLMKLDPLNGSYRSKITQLGASQTIDRGGYEGAKTTREAQKKGYEADDLGSSRQAVDGPGMSVEADLLRQIRKDPSVVANYIKLAEYYRKESQLEKLVETLKNAFQVSQDPNIREQMEDAELDNYKRNLALAKEAAAKGDANAQQNAAAIANELLAREVDIFSRRTERYPQDLRLKFELAERFFRMKKFAQAIPLYQQASNDPRLEGTILVNLGKCFVAEGKKDLARRQFEKAVTRLTPQDNPGPYKECHYILGRLYEELKNVEKAEHHYNEVLAVDYAYKDTTARLEKLQANPS